MLEDYRAGLGVDRGHDAANRDAGRRLACPALVLWSTRDDMEYLYGDPLSVWRNRAPDLRGFGIDSGHHLAKKHQKTSPAHWVTSLSAQPCKRPQTPSRGLPHLPSTR